ncbi:MAG: D-alanyl-D-alanine carboxypeptidase [Betaproteobacteria bacterium]|nr:D-alanyl-D-alanine carboxypeptidase [Betaproteobacteria bacterium]
MPSRLSLLSLPALLLAAAAWATVPAAPQLDAPAYILIDALTGKSLAEKAVDEPRRPASLAKMMTAYLAFEAIAAGRRQLDEPVRVSRRASEAGGYKMGFTAGEQVELELLLLAMIHRSGNDAAEAIAELLGGSSDQFVATMNRKAAQLGMEDTVFGNPSGRDEPGVVSTSTARDLARLAARTIADFPQLYRLYGIDDFEFGRARLPSRNRLLASLAGADGLKTGHTSAAGHCLAASMMRRDREGMRLIAVVLGAASADARDAAAGELFAYGYRNWQSVLLLAEPQPTLGQIRVWGGQADQVALRPDTSLPVKLLLPRDQAEQLSAQLELPEWLEAPLSAGDAAGRLIISAGAHTVLEIPAVASEAVAAGPWWKRASDYVRLHWVSPPQRTVAGVGK